MQTGALLGDVITSAGKTIIGIDGIVSEETRGNVHHFLFFGEDYDGIGGQDLLYAWAPGAFPFILPDDVGIIGGRYANWQDLDTPSYPRICSKTLMGCFVPPSDDVIIFEGTGTL